MTIGFGFKNRALWPCVFSKFVIQSATMREQDLRLGYKPTFPCWASVFHFFFPLFILCQQQRDSTLNATAVLGIRTWRRPHTPSLAAAIFLFLHCHKGSSSSSSKHWSKFIKVSFKARLRQLAYLQRQWNIWWSDNARIIFCLLMRPPVDFSELGGLKIKWYWEKIKIEHGNTAATFIYLIVFNVVLVL